MKYILLAFIAFSTAHAAQDGNGGDVLTCPPAIRKPIELLDFYEAGKRGIQYSLGDKNLSVRTKVEIYLNRLNVLSPQRRKIYADSVEPLLKDIEAYLADKTKLQGVVTNFTEDELADIPDSDHLTYPLGCRVEQLVIRRKPIFEEDRLFTINVRLLNQLDNDNLAGAIMHEGIYGDAIDNHGHTNSIMARYFHSKLSTGEFEQYTVKDFYELVDRARMDYFEYDGLKLFTFKGYDYDAPTFHPNGMVSTAQSKFEHSNQLGPKVWVDSVRYFPSGRIQYITGKTTNTFEQNKYFSESTYFYPDGKLHQILKYGGAKHEFLGKIKNAYIYIFNRSGEITGRLQDGEIWYGGNADVDLINYDKTPLVPQTAIDDYIDHPRKVEDQVAAFVTPTYKDSPILQLNTYLTSTLCQKMGFERLLTFRLKKVKEGKAWALNKDNEWYEYDVKKLRKDKVDTQAISKIYCDGFVSE